MRHRLYLLPFLALFCLPVALGAVPDTSRPPSGPEIWQAAASWLALVDARKYSESWSEASRVFQASVTAEAWGRRAASLRDGSGDPYSRELLDSHEVTDPTGVPPGEYVRLRFECQCTRAGTIRETVLMVNEGARGWRVASYTVEEA